jgi:hypothetical protein
MAKLVAGTFFLFASVYVGLFVIKAMLRTSKLNWPIVLGTIVTCSGSFFAGGLLLAEGAIDYFIDYGLPLRYETSIALPAPTLAPTPISAAEQSLEICEANYTTINDIMEADKERISFLQFDLDSCILRISKITQEYNEINEALFNLTGTYYGE